MIQEQLNTLIADAMKSGDKVRVETFKAVKTAFTYWKTNKTNLGKEMNEAVETNIIRKLISQYDDTAHQCDDGKHDDLVQSARQSISILSSYLPAAASEDDIINLFKELEASGVEPIKKNMGIFIRYIKSKSPAADGKMVSETVMKNLK